MPAFKLPVEVAAAWLSALPEDERRTLFRNAADDLITKGDMAMLAGVLLEAMDAAARLALLRQACAEAGLVVLTAEQAEWAATVIAEQWPCPTPEEADTLDALRGEGGGGR